MLGILLYCRPGFENDCANEIQAKAVNWKSLVILKH